MQSWAGQCGLYKLLYRSTTKFNGVINFIDLNLWSLFYKELWIQNIMNTITNVRSSCCLISRWVPSGFPTHVVCCANWYLDWAKSSSNKADHHVWARPQQHEVCLVGTWGIQSLDSEASQYLQENMEIKSTFEGRKRDHFQQDWFNKLVGDYGYGLYEKKRFIHLYKHHRCDVLFQGLLHYVVCKPWDGLSSSNECHWWLLLWESSPAEVLVIIHL